MTSLTNGEWYGEEDKQITKNATIVVALLGLHILGLLKNQTPPFRLPKMQERFGVTSNSKMTLFVSH
jgi:hypothetical protein